MYFYKNKLLLSLNINRNFALFIKHNFFLPSLGLPLNGTKSETGLKHLFTFRMKTVYRVGLYK